MSAIKKGVAVFEPRARVIKLLGEELITNEIIAIVELVKNAYDACATEVIVKLEDVDQEELGTISIQDNGTGMSLETVLTSWIQIGTDHRKQQREEDSTNKLCNRPILGEKGVGRFAAQKLGSLINVITKIEGDKLETVIEVNWDQFDETKLLSEVYIDWFQRNPVIYKNEEAGTKLEITFINKSWTGQMIRELFLKLNILNSPFPTKDTFNVNVVTNVFQEYTIQPPSMGDIIARSVYSLRGEIDEKGKLDADYIFYNSAYTQFSRDKPILENLLENDPKAFPQGRLPTCGPFKINYYAWDLDPISLRETISRSYYLRMIRPYTGMKVYRDGFRVWPYGEPDDDWLSMDGRRVNVPTRRFSRNQIIGIIEITYENNPELIDKTDREGIIDDVNLVDFKALIMATMRIFENERRSDKDKTDAMRERKTIEDEVYEAINELKRSLESNKHFNIYEKNIDKIERVYKMRVKEISSKLLVSAGIGIAYMMPAHDIADSMIYIKDNIKKIINYKIFDRDIIQPELEVLLETSNNILELTKGIRNIGRRTYFTDIKLSSIVNSTINMMKHKLKSEDVKYEFKTIVDSTINGNKSLLTVALMNLIDNSSYWIKTKPKSQWKIKIIVDKDVSNAPRIVVSDEGPGFKDPPEMVVEPFYSRKPNGSGLGLYIVSEIMGNHNGRLDFLHSDDSNGLYSGANVALVFTSSEDVPE